MRFASSCFITIFWFALFFIVVRSSIVPSSLVHTESRRSKSSHNSKSVNISGAGPISNVATRIRHSFRSAKNIVWYRTPAAAQTTTLTTTIQTTTTTPAWIVSKRESSSIPNLPSFRRLLNRWRPPRAERRFLFSFNRLLLSLIAPRLMRYQFDLMMHSVVAELFRKILVPVIGGSASSSPSIFPLIGNLLRLRNTPAETTPRTTTSAPTVDVQRLLDNAQKLIALQTVLGNRNQAAAVPTTTTNNNKPISENTANSAHGALNQNQVSNDNFNRPDAMNSKVDEQKASKSNSKTTSTDQSAIQLAISAKDFLNFLQKNFKQPQKSHEQAHHITNDSTATAAADKEKNTDFQAAQTSSSNINHHTPHSFLSSSVANLSPPSEHSILNTKANADDEAIESLLQSRQPSHRTHRPSMDDFKMSHLTFIDTEVPNYGNQLLVRDITDRGTVTSNRVSAAPISDNFSVKNQLGLIDSSMLQSAENGLHHLKNDDLERANRWNNVLVNMNGINGQPNG